MSIYFFIFIPFLNLQLLNNMQSLNNRNDTHEPRFFKQNYFIILF